LKKQPKDYLKSSHRLELELERAILTGLGHEWDSGCNELPSQISAALQRPTFRLSDLRSRWGYWSGASRLIVISRQLALKYPWDSVREILLHEMAHQVAEQALGGADQPAHGHAFHQACAMLQANPAASGNYPVLEDRIRSGGINQGDAMTARVDKLMSLAQSRNRHEAEAAMLKAHELIAKYNIERIEGGCEQNFISAFVGKPALRHYQDAYQMANLLQDCYFVRGIWVRAYVIERKKMGRVLEISGTPKNVSIARHVHMVLARAIRTEWHKFKSAQGVPAQARLDFAVGIISGFKQKIELQYAGPDAKPGLKDLVRKGDPKLERYFTVRYPRTRSISRAARQHHASVEAAGKRIGRGLVIARAVTDRVQNLTGLLPHKTSRSQ